MKKIIALIVVVVAIAGGYIYFSGEETSALTLDVNLEPLISGQYEIWAIIGQDVLSLGTFNAGDEMTFESERDLSDADVVIITIEPENDLDTEPSGIVVLFGILNKEIEEEQTVALSFPIDLSTAMGNYILATPTNGGNTNEVSGVWFLTLPEPLTAGLSLPELPVGWIYEGWVVHEGKPLTSGRFASAIGEDLFNGFSGTESGPPFPGEDYLLNAPEGVTFPINLANGSSKIVISIEPDLGGKDPTGDGPFQAKPFVADVPENAADHTNLPMMLNLSSLPSGTVTVR